MGIIAFTAGDILKLHYEIMRLGLTGSGFDLFSGGQWAAVLDVVKDRAMEQGGVLCHHSDLSAQALLCDL